jgi:hypothetical protein
MAYRPRRRGGIAKEVASFATAFTQGMKLFSNDDRYGRSRARDPYSDENLAKRDERLGTTSALGRLFGRGENELTGFDRGRAALEEKMRVAAERGDASAYQKFAAERVLLEQQAANPAVGEKWNSPPAPARTEPPARTGAGAGAGGAGGDGGGDGGGGSGTGRGASLGTGSGAAVVPVSATINQAPISTTLSAIPTQQTVSPAATEPEQQASLPPDAEPAQTVAYEWNPDQGSIFDAANVGTTFAVGGGMVPTTYAALGGSMTSRTGATGGALTMDEVENPGARYTGGLEYGTYEGDDEGRAVDGELAPAEYDPNAPAVNDDERGAVTGNLGLPRDPEELSAVAAPAIAAGVNRIQAELKPTGAISTQDPAYQEKLQRFARGEGRMSEEEIKQLDSVVDPDGKLPQASRSAARIAAIYKFYTDRGEPDTARDVAARVILYDKFASQTRGAMALQALRNGDIDSGVKLLEDAYNQNMPDAKTVRVDRDDNGLVQINQDGTVNFNIGWDKLTGFVPTQKGRVDKEGLIQLASNTATGTEPMKRFMQAAGSKAPAAGGAGATGGARAQAATAAKEFETNRGAVETAAKAVAAARTGDDPEALRAAEENLRAAVAKAQGGARSVNELNQRNTMLRNTINGAITSSAVPTARAPASGTGGGTREERAAAERAARLEALDRRARALSADVSASPIVEEEEQYRIKRGLQEIDLARLNIASEDVPRRTAFSKEFEKRVEPVNKYLDELLTEGLPEGPSGKIDVKLLPQMQKDDRRRFVDIADRMLSMNDVSPEAVTLGLYNMVSADPRVAPKMVSDGKGGALLEVSGRRFYVDRQLYRDIAILRGENVSRAKQKELAGFVAKQEKEQAARETAVLPIDREQAVTGMNMKIQSGTDLIEPALTPSSRFFQRQPPRRYNPDGTLRR